MIEQANEDYSSEGVIAQIASAFPDMTFTGSITAADGLRNEELDEERALYAALNGKKWSEVSESFIEANPDGVVLLTKEAFSAFLPAWLNCAVTNKDVREMLIYMFEPDGKNEASHDLIAHRTRELSHPQRKAIEGFLGYCVNIESSPRLRERAKNAFSNVVKTSGE